MSAGSASKRTRKREAGEELKTIVDDDGNDVPVQPSPLLSTASNDAVMDADLMQTAMLLLYCSGVSSRHDKERKLTKNQRTENKALRNMPLTTAPAPAPAAGTAAAAGTAPAPAGTAPAPAGTAPTDTAPWSFSARYDNQ
jgi:uncharacterized protein YnzC (UPF0291/DUF896 family)